MKNNLLLQRPQNDVIEDKYFENIVYRYLEFVNTPLNNLNKRYALNAGELFYHCLYSIDDIKSSSFNEQRLQSSLLWDELIAHARTKDIDIDDIEIIHMLMTIAYGVYRLLLLDEKLEYTEPAGLIVSRLIEIDASQVHILLQHFNRATTIVGESKLSMWVTTYLHSKQSITDELDNILASKSAIIDTNIDLPTKENLDAVFKYTYTQTNDFTNLIDFLREERKRASDGDWARYALALKESNVLKRNEHTKAFTNWLQFFCNMFGKDVPYSEPNKLRRSKCVRDINIYLPQHVG